MASEFTVVRQSGSGALVEYHTKAGLVRRVTIPADQVTEQGVAPEVLQAGVPYGVDWEAVIARACHPERIADEMRKVGLWTLRDVRNAPMKVAKVLIRHLPRVNDLLVIIERMEGKK